MAAAGYTARTLTLWEYRRAYYGAYLLVCNRHRKLLSAHPARPPARGRDGKVRPLPALAAGFRPGAGAGDSFPALRPAHSSHLAGTRQIRLGFRRRHVSGLVQA